MVKVFLIDSIMLASSKIDDVLTELGGLHHVLPILDQIWKAQVQVLSPRTLTDPNRNFSVILVSAPDPLGLIWVFNWVGLGLVWGIRVWGQGLTIYK